MLVPMNMLRSLGLVALSLVLLLPGCKHEQTSEQAGDQAPVGADGFPDGPYQDRNPALAKQLVDAGALLLDVRTPGEFAGGHVEGAINIDHQEVAARIEEIRELQGGDAHKPIVVYCRSGRRSGIAKQQLEDAGFDRVTNLGGISDWPD